MTVLKPLGEHGLLLFLLQFALLLVRTPHARRSCAGAVVMASGRKPSTHRAFFGHRIDHVITHATCPVAVVAASSTNGAKK